MGILDKVILGIHDGHDAAAAVVRNGKILCAVSEERIQRIKSAGGFPKGAIEACLDFSGLRKSDIDYVALAGTRAVPVNMLGTLSRLSYEDFVRIQEKVRYPKYYEGRNVSFSSLFPDYKPRGNVYYPLDRVPLKETQEMSREERVRLARFREEFVSEQCGISQDRVFRVDHHKCHAYYAYYASPHRERNVTALTMDAGGDGIYESVCTFDEEGRFRRLHASHDCIIGPLYTYVTLLLGMRPFEHEYKVMGLAPYAKEHVKQAARQVFLTYMTVDGLTFTRNPAVKDLYWHTKEAMKYERFDGIAGGIQDFAEHFLRLWVRNAITATGAGDVVFGGGVSLNVKANKSICELAEVDSFFVPPGPGDESLPIGAAWALMDRLDSAGGHRHAIEPLTNAYLGPDFCESDVEMFRRHPAVQGYYIEVPGDPIGQVTEALTQGEIVALCRGRMEFGPRALGNRSLIASANNRDVVMRINEAIKGRDFWMPFAPSILDDYVSEYLRVDGRADLSYMTVCTDSLPKARNDLIAALHPYDFTARPNVVSPEMAPHNHELLSRYARRTGIGGVLNTSLNIHGKPIVMKPLDVANELLNDASVNLNCMLIGNHFFRRNGSNT